MPKRKISRDIFCERTYFTGYSMWYVRANKLHSSPLRYISCPYTQRVYIYDDDHKLSIHTTAADTMALKWQIVHSYHSIFHCEGGHVYRVIQFSIGANWQIKCWKIIMNLHWLAHSWLSRLTRRWTQIDVHTDGNR